MQQEAGRRGAQRKAPWLGALRKLPKGAHGCTRPTERGGADRPNSSGGGRLWTPGPEWAPSRGSRAEREGSSQSHLLHQLIDPLAVPTNAMTKTGYQLDGVKECKSTICDSNDIYFVTYLEVIQVYLFEKYFY